VLFRSLDAPNPGIARALVVVHGAGRDADNYFRSVIAAAFLADALENTIVISPLFASHDGGSCQDKLRPHEVSWSCSGDTWRSGGTAASDPKLTSYDFMDEILRKLARKDVFPNLKNIVLTGHSAGGQFVTRYEMANRIHETLGVPVSYVVSNPSSYAYPDARRPSGEGASATFRGYSDARNCTTYNIWPYGLDQRTGYAAGLTASQLKQQLASRPTIYLLGEIDILPVGGFDGSCPAMAEGPTRRARGEAFGKYVNATYGAKHTVVIVPLCGHNGRCMFTSDVALPLLFPKE
jgi:pimeloyl-ACP methyl ester carboxylesterase